MLLPTLPLRNSAIRYIRAFDFFRIFAILRRGGKEIAFGIRTVFKIVFKRLPSSLAR
jgi:hypothetical protein